MTKEDLVQLFIGASADAVYELADEAYRVGETALGRCLGNYAMKKEEEEKKALDEPKPTVVQSGWSNKPIQV